MELLNEFNSEGADWLHHSHRNALKAVTNYSGAWALILIYLWNRCHTGGVQFSCHVRLPLDQKSWTSCWMVVLRLAPSQSYLESFAQVLMSQIPVGGHLVSILLLSLHLCMTAGKSQLCHTIAVTCQLPIDNGGAEGMLQFSNLFCHLHWDVHQLIIQGNAFTSTPREHLDLRDFWLWRRGISFRRWFLPKLINHNLCL